MYKNNHYAQKAIIKHWSARNHQGHYDGFVWQYDFESDSPSRKHVDDVFVRTGLFSREEEERFSSLVEQPLALFRDRQLKSQCSVIMPKKAPVSVDQKTIRALSLLWALNTARFSDAQVAEVGAESKKGSEFAQLSDAAVDRVVNWFLKRFELRVIPAGANPSLYPELGCYPFPIEGEVASTFGVAFPLDPNLILAAWPIGFEERSTSQMWAFSVGMGRSRFALLHPDPDIRESVVPSLPAIRRQANAYLHVLRASESFRSPALD